MSNDTELFELCKEVYERLPMWDSTEKCYAFIDEFNQGEKHWRVIPLHEDNVDDVDEWHPLYTSDYLLEKLPAKLIYNKTDYFYYLEKFDDGSYGTGYGFTDEGGHIDHPLIGVLTDDVALNANLKLTLALKKVGEL